MDTVLLKPCSMVEERKLLNFKTIDGLLALDISELNITEQNLNITEHSLDISEHCTEFS